MFLDRFSFIFYEISNNGIFGGLKVMTENTGLNDSLTIDNLWSLIRESPIFLFEAYTFNPTGYSRARQELHELRREYDERNMIIPFNFEGFYLVTAQKEEVIKWTHKESLQEYLEKMDAE